MLALTAEEQLTLAREVCTAKEIEAWQLVEIDGLSLYQAAARLEISRSALRARHTAARRKIHARIRSEFPATEREGPSAPLSLSELYSLPRLDPAIALLIERDGAACYLCREQPVDPRDYVVEHIIPRWAGGTNHPRNLALACATCNAKKGSALVSVLVSSGRVVYTPTAEVGEIERPARPPLTTR